MMTSSNGNGCRCWVRSVVAVSLAVASLCAMSGSFSPSGPHTQSGVLSGSGGQANAAEPPQAEDHPFAVVALASFDRLRARAASLGEAIGSPEFSDKWIASGFMGDESFGKLFNSPGFDPTRPIGIMSYPKWFSGEVEKAGKSNGGNAAEKTELPSLEDLFTNPLDMMTSGFMENATVVYGLPAKDREQLLATVAEVMSEKFTPVAGRPGWYRPEGDDEDEDLRIVFVGRYLLLLVDDGKVKQWDRNYPDFEKLAKSSLGQNGFAYSLYRRGLPKLVREDMAEAFKQAHAATLQRYDNEPEAAFKFRTMFGPLMTESLDLLLSQIEEFRITGHVDSNTHQILVDAELIGPKDGKLAKLANAMTTKSSLFGGISTDDALFAASVSLPLSTKLWKPVAEFMRTVSETTQETTWLPELARTLAKTIEVGQLELHVSYTRGGEGLLALRVAGNAAFPEQVQAALESFGKPVDSVEGWPIHQLPSSVLGYLGLVGLDPSALFSLRAIETTTRVEIDGDGNNREVTEVRQVPPSEAPCLCWLAATPSGIWLAMSSPQNRDGPAWFKSAIEASLAKPTAKAAANRSNAPVRVVLRGLGASPPATDSANEKPRDAKVTQAAAKGVDKGERFVIDIDLDGAERSNIVVGGKPRKMTAEELAAAKAQHERAEQQERERGDLLRDGSNAIRVELRPTANGLRARTTFDDAYFHWFATMMKHSLDEQALQMLPLNVAPPEPVPPPPPLK